MHRAAANFRAISQHAFMDMMAVETGSAKGRDQRRMDVHHAAGKVVRNVYQLQKARHADEVGPGRATAFEDPAAKLFAATGFLAVDDHSRNASVGGTGQAVSISIVG